ncbi:MAG TPA: restriction endonuclease subunit S [Jeotgalicoccus sp.]|nr:restriction endonuclease subunit S [Jeotgalicoccus sp.]
MTMEERKVPELRFKGFHDDWEQRKLEQISDKVTEKNKQEIFKEVLTNSAEFGIVSQESYFDKEIANVKNISGYYIVRPNDFVYNPRISNFAPVGPIKRNTLFITGIMSPLYYVFRTKNISTTYLQKYFESTHWHRFMYMNGDSGARSDRFAIKDTTFNKMPIPYPVFEEQKSISNFISKLDKIITLHQRKINILKEQQKAYLRIIFPSKNKNAPKLRFISYTEKWNEYKLGELMEIGSVKRIHKSDWKEKGIRFLRARDIVSFFKNEEPAEKLYISRDTFENYSKTTGKVSPGDLLVTGVGSIGVPLLIKDLKPLYFKDGNIIWFKNQTLDGYYFYYYFVSDNIQRFISNVAGIGTVGTYTISNGKKTPIKFPSMVEQKLIGHFLFKIEKNLLLNERKVKALNKLKELYLRKMFL